jgi:polynucleotide 5'-kinase involved in rRNA processing
MDLDPGQTEFTPPGLISLNEVTTPLFGPPCTHMRDPLQTYFIGDVTPQNDVEQFEKSALALFETWRETSDTCPLVINSHGWMQGRGYTSQVKLINHMRPQRIVQLADEPSKAPLRIADLKASQHGTDWLPLVHALPSAVCAAPRVRHTAADLRSHAYRCYFEDARCRTLRVSWRQLCVAFADQLPPSQAFYALNGTVVALAVDHRPRRLLNEVSTASAENRLTRVRGSTTLPISCPST